MSGETILHDRDVTMRFIVSSGIGFDAEACHMAQNAPMKSILNRLSLGKLVYIYEAVKLIFTWKSVPAVLTFAPRKDEGELVQKQDRFVFTAAMNHRYEGGGFMMCPQASGDDGKLDFCIVHDLTVTGFFRFFPLALKGKHVKHKECVGQARRTSLRIQKREASVRALRRGDKVYVKRCGDEDRAVPAEQYGVNREKPGKYCNFGLEPLTKNMV